MPILEYFAAAGLFAFGAYLVHRAISSWRVVRAGLFPAAASGADFSRVDLPVRSVRPIQALNGSSAVAVQRCVRFAYVTKDDFTHTSPLRNSVLPSTIALADGYVISGKSVSLLGPESNYDLTPSEVESQYPELWAELSGTSLGDIKRVFAFETVIPDGADGFLLGIVKLDTSFDPSQGHRRRFSVSGAGARPVVVSGWDLATAQRKLLAPMKGLIVLALLCWSLAALVIALTIHVGRY